MEVTAGPPPWRHLTSESGAHFSDHWDRLLFRDYLIEHPEAARDYEALKRHLAATFPHVRVAYTRGKSAFIEEIPRLAKRRSGA